jgi:hypothetical protein
MWPKFVLYQPAKELGQFEVEATNNQTQTVILEVFLIFSFLSVI